MKRSLYLECASGISGDMAVAALLDLGADRQRLMTVLNSLPLEGFSAEISRVSKSGLDCCDFRVNLDAEHENHDHDMEYLHGHDGGHTHGPEPHHGHTHEAGDGGHTHGPEPHHGHTHEAEDGGHTHGPGHGHVHRGLPEIRQILDGSALSPEERELTDKIFRILAEAESEAHGVPVEEVHFHEVGAVDSIVDIVAAAVCFVSLGVAEVIVPSLAEGHGTIRSQHGILPVPVPATLNIIRRHGLVLMPVDVEGELVTPTGAAIAAALRTSGKLPARACVAGTGIGAGKRTYSRPSFLRAILLEEPEEEGSYADEILCLESNIDDSSGELLGLLVEKLLEAGARDVSYTPVFMKKNRPAYQLNVICTEDNRKALERMIFAETSTIGIRRTAMQRTVMEREIKTVSTCWGDVRVKVSTLEDIRKVSPEYEDVRDISLREGIPFRVVFETVLSKAGRELSE